MPKGNNKTQKDILPSVTQHDHHCQTPEGGGVLGSIFAGYGPLASPNPYPIIVYSVANHRPHLSHF